MGQQTPPRAGLRDRRPRALASLWIPGTSPGMPPEEPMMWGEIQFGFALAVSGLSIGLMYSLIALGFVLVYKATDAINFAQGEFVMLAGFVAALVLAIKGMPVMGAVVAAL